MGRNRPATPSAKVFGIGVSKTGTTTLERCFQMLNLGRHKGYDRRLSKRLIAGNPEPALQVAEKYDTFDDHPWYGLFRELDARFPGSKFVLTVRKDSMTHAKSSWEHGVRAGIRRGEPTETYLREKIAWYERHNANVLQYFRNRADDLLVVCWENGDGWETLCPFLGVSIPDRPFPHCNKGTYRHAGIRGRIQNSLPYTILRHGRYVASTWPVVRAVKHLTWDRVARDSMK